jgi:ribosome-associated toxin RatA of RatAB toxin-antitoxin module
MALEKINSTAIVQGNIRKISVWNLISDFSLFPKIIKNIDRINIIEKSAAEGRSEWNITIDKAPFTWIEKDIFDKENFQIRFKSIYGDFEHLDGFWKIQDFRNKGIAVSFSIEYSLGIPVIEEALGPVFKAKMQNFVNTIADAIRNECVKHTIEERSYERMHIGKVVPVKINDTSVKVGIVNISRGGIMLNYGGNLFNASRITVTAENAIINATVKENDTKNTLVRAQFDSALTDAQLHSFIDFTKKHTTGVFEAIVSEEETFAVT